MIATASGAARRGAGYHGRDTMLRTVLLFVLLICQQVPDLPARHDREDLKLPNGKTQREEIVKADHQKNLEDAQKLVNLGDELKKSLEKNTQYVVAVDDLKKLDEIEKVTRRIRARLRRY